MPSPWSVSTAGWIPRASSRKSASAACSSPSVSSEQHAALPVSDVRPEELEGHTEAEQPLLGTIVQVALQPAPLLITRTHDPRPRLTQLRKLRAQLRLQPLILEGEAGRRPGRLQQRRLIEQHRVVDDRGELISDESDCAVRSPGSLTSRPCSSTQPFCWGTQSANSSVGSPIARTRASRTPPGPTLPRSTTRSPTTPRARRVVSKPPIVVSAIPQPPMAPMYDSRMFE